MKEQVSSILDERYYEIDHPTGLKIFVMPKAHYRSAYAVIGTKYGSIDNRFKRSDAAEYTQVPEGIAHFLEHKLFESEELDAFQRFAATGASANAYTSFDKTCYLFQCSDRFDQSLEILLDFVQHPYFTPQTVEKEQGIIGQEITMYYDVPGWMSTFNLLRCLYKNHPVRIDIAGTVESISHITDKLLYDCYNTFYNLHNMALAVVGNVTPEQVLAVCDRCLTDSRCDGRAGVPAGTARDRAGLSRVSFGYLHSGVLLWLKRSLHQAGAGHRDHYSHQSAAGDYGR